MKKFGLTLMWGGCLLYSPPAIADTVDNNDWKAVAEIDVLSGNFLPPRAIIQSDDPVYQVSLNIAHKSGLYGDAWISTKIGDMPLTDRRESRAELTLGYRKKVIGLDVRTSVALFMVPKLGDLNGDTVQIDLEASKTFRLNQHHSIRPYVLVEMNPVIGRPDTGTFYHVGVSHIWKQGVWSLSNQVTYVRNDGSKKDIALYTGRIGYAGIPHLTISPLIVRGFHDLTAHRTKFVLGAGVSTTF